MVMLQYVQTQHAEIVMLKHLEIVQKEASDHEFNAIMQLLQVQEQHV